MCDPVTIASAALTIGGSLMQANAARGAQRRADGAMSAERIRQQGFRDQAAAAFGRSVDTSTRPAVDARMDTAQTARREQYDRAIIPFNANTDLSAGERRASPVVRGAIENNIAGATAKGKAEGAARALLNAWGDQNLGQRIDLTRNRGDIATTANMAQGSANVLPLEISAAQRTGKSGVGDLLVGLGQIGLGAKGSLGASAPTWGGVGRAIQNPSQGWADVSGAFSRFFQ